MKKLIELPITLHAGQQKIYDSKARFKVVEAGRRFGKTKYALFWLAEGAAKPGTVNWLVAPTYRQAKEVAWRELLHLLPQEIIRSKNATDLTVELKNSSIISLKGAEDPDNLRGKPLHRLACEEAAYMKPYAWSDVLRASLADHIGPALFISTPRGNNWFHKLYELGKSGSDPDWESFHFTIYDNPHIPPSEIEKLRASPEISQVTWRQEYMAEVFANVGQVYAEFDPVKNLFIPSENYIGHEQWLCVRGIDWGMNDDLGCVWLHVSPATGHVLVSREHVKNNWAVPKHADVIKTNSMGRNISNGNTVLDISAFRREGGSQISVGAQFAKEGIVCTPSEKNSMVGMDILKRFLEGDGVKPWLYVSTSCQKTIEGLQNWEYGSHEPDILAALRYGLMHIYRRGYSQVAQGVHVVEREENDPNLVKVGADGTRYIRQPESRDLSWDYEYGVPY